MAFTWTNRITEPADYGLRLTDISDLDIYDLHVQEMRTHINTLRHHVALADMDAITPNQRLDFTYESTERLTNSSMAFDGATLTGWTYSISGDNNVEIDTTYKVNTNSAKLSGTNMSISQTVSGIKSSRAYKLTILARPHAYKLVPMIVKVYATDGTDSTYYDFYNNTWSETETYSVFDCDPFYKGTVTNDFTECTMIINTPAAVPLSLTITVQMGEANETLYIDSISLLKSTSHLYKLRDALDIAAEANVCSGHCPEHYADHCNGVNSTHKSTHDTTVYPNVSAPDACSGHFAAHNNGVLTSYDTGYNNGVKTFNYSAPHNYNDLGTDYITYNGTEDHDNKATHDSAHCVTNYATDDASLYSGNDNAVLVSHNGTYNTAANPAYDFSYKSGECQSDCGSAHYSTVYSSEKLTEYSPHDSDHKITNNSTYCTTVLNGDYAPHYVIVHTSLLGGTG